MSDVIPVPNFAVTVPEEFMGEAVGELLARRGGFATWMDTSNGICEFRVHIGVESMRGYESWLAKLTSGKGRVTQING